MPQIKTITEAAAKAATRRGKAGERVQFATAQLLGLEPGKALSIMPDVGESTGMWRSAVKAAAAALDIPVRIKVASDGWIYVSKMNPPQMPSQEQKGSADEAFILGVLPTTTDMGDVILARTRAQLDAAIAEARVPTLSGDLTVPGPMKDVELWPADRFVYACEKRPGKPPHPHGASGTCLEVA